MHPPIQLYAVFGQPIAHSLSPVIHNAAFQARSLPAYYFPVECAFSELADKLAAFRGLGGTGVNLTRPLKEAVIPQLAKKSEWVDAAGAANILRVEADQWMGDNTDCQALYRLLDKVGMRSRDALVLGSGGAARASAAVLRRHGYRVVAAARKPAMCDWADEALPWSNRLTKASWHIVVNATPLGQEGELQETRWPLPHPGGIAVDWVYRPRKTLFLQQAEEHGAVMLDGLTLLIEQAALGWLTWIGQEGPREVMWKAATLWQ